MQREPPSRNETLDTLKLSTEKLIVPDIINASIPLERRIKSPEPKFEANVELDWFLNDVPTGHQEIQATAKDMAFLLKRRSENLKRGWSMYNQNIRDCSMEVTTVGYMPIVLSPAHEYQTFNTVVKH